MKQIFRIFVLFTLIMVLGIISFINVSKKVAYEKRDLLYYNDMLFSIQDKLEAGVPIEDIESDYDCVIVLSTKINDPQLSQLYASGALVLDLSVDGEYVGKVAWDDMQDSFYKAGREFFKAAMMLWGAILLCGYLLLYFLYAGFVKPVEELTGFATDIAKGDLDKPLPIRKNNMFGSFIEGFDIMREEIKASMDRERRTEIARKELIQGLSHDIKTPVAVIKATCEVLQMKYARKLIELEEKTETGSVHSDDDIVSITAEEDECKETLDKIGSVMSKADTISLLMSEVMHANLEEMEKVDVHPAEENSTLIEEFITHVGASGNVIFNNHIHPCLVYMDKRRMEQVIDNVIGNSYKYAGTDIHVSFAQTDDILMADGSKGRFIRITIKDDGPGVNPEDLPLIAEKYYRGRNSTEQTGYGLGMYLTKKYMEEQGGGMEYYNDNGFVVELLLRIV